MAPRLDVCVVTYNTAELSAAALRRLCDSDQGVDLRLLVHDNASDDGTPAALAAAVPEAEVEVSGTNLGFARAVNRLLERSDAPWVVALNSDAWPEPGALGRLVAAAEAHPEAAVVVPKLLRPDGSLEHSTHPFPTVTLALAEVTGGRRWLPRRLRRRWCLEGAWDHDRPRDVDWAVGACWLWRRAALDQVGGLDERFFMYVEDLDWCWRARRAGWAVRFEPAAVVRHVGNASGRARFGDARLGLEAANLRLFLADSLGPAAPLYRGLQAAAGARRLIGATLAGRPGQAAEGRRQVKAHLGLLAPPPLPAPADDPDPEPAPGGPAVAVCVSTCDRADRLARLVAALEAQSLDPAAFEVVVTDDGSRDDTAETLAKLAATSPLALRVLTHPTRRGPAAGRNRAWRASRAPVVAFTDDDCVPQPGWLEAGLAAMAGRRAVVAGRTAPPPDQLARAAGPYARVMEVAEARFFETCNVFYRRRDLAAVGGFDESFRRPSGEDTHLALAVLELGVEPVYAADAVVHHDVRPGSLAANAKEAWRWADLPLVVRRHPSRRGELCHRRVFWKPTHPPAIAAGVGLLAAWRWPPALVLVAPWLVHRARRGPHPLRAWPGLLAVDLVEVAAMVRGSLRHRTVLL